MASLLRDDDDDEDCDDGDRPSDTTRLWRELVDHLVETGESPAAAVEAANLLLRITGAPTPNATPLAGEGAGEMMRAFKSTGVRRRAKPQT